MQQSSGASQSIFTAQGISGRNGAPRIVIDTNVALDLLVFRDPACAALVDLLDRAVLCWYSTAAMRTEFDDVLARPAFARWAGQWESIAALWALWTQCVDVAPRETHLPALLCADPDDQMFLDLALDLRPCCLLSRDRELLRLAVPARALGVRIVTPAQFNAQ
ncbi:MAG: putative toxin-antitoxin system toxin component, PIN family [Burkholderiaceae bacterium]